MKKPAIIIIPYAVCCVCWWARVKMQQISEHNISLCSLSLSCSEQDSTIAGPHYHLIKHKYSSKVGKQREGWAGGGRMKPKERYRSSSIILVKTSTTILLLLLLNPTRKNIFAISNFPLLTYLQLTHPSLAPAAAYLSMELYHDTHSSSSSSVMTMRMKEWMVWLPTFAFVLTLHAMQFSRRFLCVMWLGYFYT